MTSPPDSPESPQRLRGVRVLAAEDNEVNRMVLEQMLELEGAELAYVDDGRKLVERVARDGGAAWDVIVTDIQMPEMDGIEAARILRTLAPGLPIIGLTAHARPEQRERCLEVGMVEHITKPVEIDVLVETIARHARRRPEPAADAPPKPRTSEPAGLSIDLEALARRYAGKPAFVERLLGILRQNIVGMPDKLRAAAAAGDLKELRAIAHGLKSMAGNVLAHRVANCAIAADAAARDGQPEAAALGIELADAIEALNRDLDARGLGASPPSSAR